MSEYQKFALAEVARFQRGVTWSKEQETSDPEPGCVPVLRIPNIQEKLDTSDLLFLRGVKKASIQQCAAAKDWILMVGSNGNPQRVGNCVQINEINEYLFASFLVGIEPIQPHVVAPEFLYHLLRGPEIQRYISDDVQGSTGLSNINLGRLKAKIIDCPGIIEQRRIAEILSTLDEAIEQTETLIAKMQQVKTGMMHDLFTRGVTPDGRLRPTREQAPELYKESPLGWIPKEWAVALISEAFDIQLGKMLNKLAKTGKGSAPYLGNRAVQWDFVDCTEIEVMDFTASERVKFSLTPGDLLVCEGGDVGRTAIWRGEMEGCFYQKAIHRLRPKSGAALPAFMLRFMRFAKESGCFREFTSQSSIAHLTQEKLGAIPMLLPRPDEQSRIAKRFDAVDEQIQNEISKLAKLRDQKHGLMHDLLTGRVQASSTASDRSVRSD
jgi:type I restriction enzyme S subunit